jgi:hypothetical protein
VFIGIIRRFHFINEKIKSENLVNKKKPAPKIGAGFFTIYSYSKMILLFLNSDFLHYSYKIKKTPI